jgi:hypothetical protein
MSAGLPSSSFMGAIAPRLTDWLMELMYFRKQQSGRPTAATTRYTQA